MSASLNEMILDWQLKRFDALHVRQLYQLLQIRIAIFAVEQDCVYQDLDDLDFAAFHLLGYEIRTDRLLAYARCLPAGLRYPEPSIGRVAVASAYRGMGLGHQLVRRAIESIAAGASIRINAQAHLSAFYAQHGFRPEGDIYLEDGIRHLEMLRPGACPGPDMSR